MKLDIRPFEAGDLDPIVQFTFEDGRGENPEQWVQAVGRFPTALAERVGYD